MMNDNGSVKIIEVCKVTPSSLEDSPAPKSLPLTFFDLLLLRIHPIQQLFFYELPSNNHISFLDHVLPNLKASLALALHYYLPLAGNIIWPIHYDIPTVEVLEGDGVSLTVAESGADFQHLSGNGFRGVQEYHPLVPQLTVSDHRAAVVSLQLTLFPNKGFSIGITSHHAVLDGKTSASFINSWARLCNLHVTGGGSSSAIPVMMELMPFYDRSVINDSTGLARIYAKAWMDFEGPNNRSLKLKLPKNEPDLVRYTLEFTHQNLEKLKQWIKNEKKQQNDRISTFASTNAYLCVCTTKFEGLRDDTLGFVFPADVRSRLKPPVPANYFGNCLFCVGVSMERSKLLGEKGIVMASETISELVKSLEEGTFLDGAENLISLIIGSIRDYSAINFISIAWSPKFEIYTVDFGWGKPRKVELVSAQSPTVISQTDSKNEKGGIEIGVVKNKDEIESFVAMLVEGLESNFTSHD